MMSEIRHHIPEPLIAAYASGALDCAFSLVVASHVSLCAECAARLGAHQTIGGAVLEALPTESVSAALKERVRCALDLPAPPARQTRVNGGGGGGARDCETANFPGPVIAALAGAPPIWRSLGFGARHCVLRDREGGSARLLYIPPGQAVPEHGHSGLELTLVLRGSFQDKSGQFGVGDVEVADQSLGHTPVAGPGVPCVCLAATDAPLRFKGLIPRLLQPILGI